MTKLVSLLSGLSLAACSVVGIRSGTEEPAYQVVTRVRSVEIRSYAPRIAAETVVQGSETDARGTGFRRLAGYIFGGNTTNSEIAMTAPVAQAPSSENIAMTAPVGVAPEAGGGWRIRFFMPAKYTMETLPRPNDPQVSLVPVPPETYAVLRFSGLPGSDAVARHEKTLLATLAGSDWTPRGQPVAWFYDPPWTLPPLRRNEVAVPVARAGSR